MKMQIKRRKRISPSNLFLLELVLAILIFCVASAICVSIFAKSHILHKQAYQEAKCVEIAKNAAEILRNKETGYIIKDKFNYFYENKVSEDPYSGALTIYLDDQAYGTDQSNGTFVMTVGQAFGMNKCFIRVNPVNPVGDYGGYELEIMLGGY